MQNENKLPAVKTSYVKITQVNFHTQAENPSDNDVLAVLFYEVGKVIENLASHEFVEDITFSYVKSNNLLIKDQWWITLYVQTTHKKK